MGKYSVTLVAKGPRLGGGGGSTGQPLSKQLPGQDFEVRGSATTSMPGVLVRGAPATRLGLIAVAGWLLNACAVLCCAVLTVGGSMLQLYPYHLAEYVARVFRVTPFRWVQMHKSADADAE